MNVIHIEYKLGSYGQTIVYDKKDQPTFFSTGDPGVDFEAALAFCRGFYTIVDKSVNHFIMDEPLSSRRVAELLPSRESFIIPAQTD